MRIESQGEAAIQASKITTKTSKIEAPKVASTAKITGNIQTQSMKQQVIGEEQKDSVSKEKLEEAVKSINEFLNTQQKASKFVFHEGLDEYYVQLVDAETEEVIKEIPPERLLNAFYEMKKLAGMIIDEKI